MPQQHSELRDGSIPVTILVAARNEERNIRKCLASLRPAARVVVLDSHSQDQTATLTLEAGREVVQFDYRGGYPKKRQWALEHLAIDHQWVFLLDSDEEITSQLWLEIKQNISHPNGFTAFFVTKGFHFMQQRFRFGGFSFGAILLFRTGSARFEQPANEEAGGMDMEVHERLIVEGRVGRLRSPLIHDDYKGLEAYLDRHNKYSSWEAKLREHYFQTGSWGNENIRPNLFGDVQQRRRFIKSLIIRFPGEPWLWFLYHYVLRCGFLEGKRGLIASRFRSHYITQVRAKLYELRQLTSGPPKKHDQ